MQPSITYSFQIHNGKALNCIKYDFKNLEEMLHAVDFLNLERRPGKHGSYRTFVCVKQSSTALLSADLLKGHGDGGGGNLNPAEFVQPGDFVDQVAFTGKRGDEMEAFFGEVRNIDDFWIMMDRTAVTELMDELEGYYEDPDRARATRMNTTHMLEGMYCVAPYGEDQMWHRAKIVKILAVGEAQVFYIDYGTRGKVSQDSLRFMHRRFAALPAQAVYCQLYGIRPLRASSRPDRFSEAAREKFWELVKPALNDGIFARVMGVQRLQVRKREKGFSRPILQLKYKSKFYSINLNCGLGKPNMLFTI